MAFPSTPIGLSLLTEVHCQLLTEVHCWQGFIANCQLPVISGTVRLAGRTAYCVAYARRLLRSSRVSDTAVLLGRLSLGLRVCDDHGNAPRVLLRQASRFN